MVSFPDFKRLVIYTVICCFIVGCGGGGKKSKPTPEKIEITYGTDKVFESPQWSGDYRVGTEQFYFKDESRDELHTEEPDDKRELLVRLFYPTDATYSDNRLPVFNGKIWSDISVSGANNLVRLRQSNYQNALWDIEQEAAIATGSQHFPVVLLSHGYGGRPEEVVYLAAELASRGYIVASINHSYDSRYAEMPDGRVLNFVGVGLDDKEGFSEQDQINLGNGLLVWSSDQLFILEQLTAMNADADSNFYATMDVHRVMSLGYSYGGATTYFSAWQDARIIAAANLDGGVWRGADKKIHTPFLYVQTQDPYHLFVFDNNSADSYHLMLAKPIDHGAFADSILFWNWDYPSSKDWQISNGQAVYFSTIALVDEFFMKYYQGDSAPMLDDDEQRPDWMTLTRYFS